MKKIFLFFIIIAFCQCSAQNLVPNGDLEQFTKHYSGVCLDSSGLTALNWYMPTKCNPDYCNSNSCWPDGVPQNYSGYQNAHSDNGYFLLAMFAKDYTFEYREYIQVELSDSLKAGKKYSVKFYVSLCDSAQYAIDDIGALFTMNPLIDTVTNPPPVIIATPQIINQPGSYLTSRTEWMLISDTLIAVGGERYITIGNFKNDANIDTLFVPGGSENTSYVFGSAYYIDDVSVELDTTNGINENALKQDEILVYPNPANDKLNVSSTLPEGISGEIIFYDGIGNKIAAVKLAEGTNTTEIDLSKIAAGVYYYKVYANHLQVKTNKLIIIK